MGGGCKKANGAVRLEGCTKAFVGTTRSVARKSAAAAAEKLHGKIPLRCRERTVDILAMASS
jgi:hypothetical protein